MATSTGFFVPPDFFSQLVSSSTAIAASVLREVIKAALPGILPFIPWLVGLLFILLVMASIKALWGQTGMLGSLLYHIFYFGILGIIVWVKGLEILFSAYFDLICAVLYPTCYWLTGRVLNKFKSH